MEQGGVKENGLVVVIRRGEGEEIGTGREGLEEVGREKEKVKTIKTGKGKRTEGIRMQ